MMKTITDIAKVKEGNSRAADIIKNWIRNRATLEFLGTWEQMYSLHFKVVEFDHFKMQAGLPSFVLSLGQWIKKTNAIGMYVRSGRYGGTYAHKDVAFEFCSTINPVFKLYIAIFVDIHHKAQLNRQKLRLISLKIAFLTRIF